MYRVSVETLHDHSGGAIERDWENDVSDRIECGTYATFEEAMMQAQKLACTAYNDEIWFRNENPTDPLSTLPVACDALVFNEDDIDDDTGLPFLVDSCFYGPEEAYADKISASQSPEKVDTQALQKHLDSDRLVDFVSIDKLRVDRFYPDNDWAHTEDIHKDVALEALKNDGVRVLGREYADKLFTRIDLGSPYVAQEVRDTVANDIMDALSGSEKMPLERAIACVNPCAMNFQAVEIVDKMGYEAAFCSEAELHKAQGPSLKESAAESRDASVSLCPDMSDVATRQALVQEDYL